jgi:2-polyprenyl-3-methyl-5-hydroxy-6-metoxy-1,4-benzoquinol methylase
MDLQLEDADCYLCSAAERKLWGAENGFTAWKCTQCGLVYVSPRPSADAISAATLLGQHQVENGEIDVVGSWSWRKKDRYKRIFSKYFADFIEAGKPVSWLDIGAGFGEAVAALQDILPPGSRVQGVEPMAPKARHAKSMGLAVSQRRLDEIDETFDVISLINVFSHVPDFAGFLKQLNALMKPGGQLFVETANGGDLASAATYPDALFLPDHLMFCGETTLRRFLIEAGHKPLLFDSERRDTALWTAKSIVKAALGRPTKVTMPYTSPYRVIFMRAARASAGASEQMH